MTRHIFASLIIFLSILFFPYWIYIPILFVAIIIVPFFWEGVLFVLMIETISLGKVEMFTSLISPLTISALLVLIILLPIRERLRHV
jgi:hypothetical protein